METTKNFFREMSKANLTEEEARLFSDKLDWDVLSATASFSEGFWLENDKKVNRIAFTDNLFVPNDYANKCKHLFNPELFALNRSFDLSFALNNSWIPFRLAKRHNEHLSFSEAEWEEIAASQREAMTLGLILRENELDADFLTDHFFHEDDISRLVPKMENHQLEAIATFADFGDLFWLKHKLRFPTLLLFKNPYVKLSDATKRSLKASVTKAFDLFSVKDLKTTFLQKYAIDELYIAERLLSEPFINVIAETQPLSETFLAMYGSLLPEEFLAKNPFLVHSKQDDDM